MKYYIIDWMGNFLDSAPYTPLEFESFEDAMDHVYEIQGEDDCNVIDEHEALLRRRTMLA